MTSVITLLWVRGVHHRVTEPQRRKPGDCLCVSV